MDPQVKKKSNVFAYVLIGLIVFIVLILIFDKRKSLQEPKPSMDSPATRSAIIEYLGKDMSNKREILSEQKSQIIDFLKKEENSTPSRNISAEQKANIINSIENN